MGQRIVSSAKNSTFFENGRNFCKQIGRGDPRPAKAVFMETHAIQNRNDLFHSFSITNIRVIGIGDYFLSFFQAADDLGSAVTLFTGLYRSQYGAAAFFHIDSISVSIRHDSSGRYLQYLLFMYGMEGKVCLMSGTDAVGQAIYGKDYFTSVLLDTENGQFFRGYRR